MSVSSCDSSKIIITQPTMWVLPRSVFFLWSSLPFVASSFSSSLALNIADQSRREVRTKAVKYFILSTLVHLCNSRASELCSSWLVAWKLSNFSACRALTLLSSSRQRSLLSIIFTHSSLLFSNSATVASRLCCTKELYLKQRAKTDILKKVIYKTSRDSPEFLCASAL